MTKIKLCGLMCRRDIEAANRLHPDYIGFVFWPASRRCISTQKAAVLKNSLDPGIPAVGVFVDEDPAVIAGLLNEGVIDLAQLHGTEDEAYIAKLRALTDKPLIQAFRIRAQQNREITEKSVSSSPPSAAEDTGRFDAASSACIWNRIMSSPADHILLDSGAGTGQTFDWSVLKGIDRPYFLAGGLHTGNVSAAIRALHPYGVDVSSGIETDGAKDIDKMISFVNAVRSADDENA